MTTLASIRQLALKHGACAAQFAPFCQAIDNGNELLAWQIVMGNKIWLKLEGIQLPINLEELSNGIGIRYHENGQLYVKSNWKNGQRHGLYERFYENGRLLEKSNWKDGQRHGLNEWFHKNGQLLSKSNWENGLRPGLYERFHENG